MSPKQTNYEHLAQSMIPEYEKRGFEITYVPDKAAALEKAVSYLSKGNTVACGGSMTLTELGLVQAIKESEAVFLDRFSATTEYEKDEIFSKIAICDYYFMSTNAMTINGNLVNIDGTGNRVASLIHGPKNVIIIAGINKVCSDTHEAFKRIKLAAAPPNAVRLNRETPCAMTGQCSDCLSPDCICTHTVITRRSNIPNRIKIILVGEELGY